jgi:glycosyltransferase involved in cell wall biosynthesis
VIADDGDAEGLPVSLLEGLAAGRVCVATYESGADDIVTDGVDGFLVPQRDVTALAGAVVRASRLPVQEAERIGTAARECAAAFSWPRVARRHLDVLFPRS